VTALGTTYPLARPFFVLGTQNPIEIEGTFPLPEAQLDRFFFKLSIQTPDSSELSRIIDLTTGDMEARLEVVQGAETIERMSALVRRVKLAEHVKQYALRIVSATHPDSNEAPETVKSHVKYGASPRAAQSMILGAKARALARGRYNVSVEDLVELAIPSLNHRVILNFEGEVAGLTKVEVLREVLANVQP